VVFLRVIQLLIIIFILLLAGCGQVDKNAPGEITTSPAGRLSTDSQKDIPILIGKKRARASLSEVDNIMDELGWTKCPSGLPEKTGVWDGKQNLVKNVSVTRKAFQKDDYIYVDLTLESSKAQKGDTLEISYDDNEVYAIERYQGEGLEMRPGIGGANGKVIDGSRDEYWYAFLLKKRSRDRSAAIPVVINMEMSGKYYFWETIILTD